MSKTVYDFSKWNIITDFNVIKNEAAGVILRCGYRSGTSGKLQIDPVFVDYITKLNALHVPVGVYFFSSAINTTEAIEEANFIVGLLISDVLKNIKLSFPIFIDTEYCNSKHTGRSDGLSKNVRTDIIVTFINQCNAWGYAAGIYASDSWFKAKLDMNRIKDYKKWNAKYSNSKPNLCTTNMVGWQKTSNHRTSGVADRIDMSEWYDDINITKSVYIKSATESSNKEIVTGQKIKLNKAPLYSSSTSTKVVSYKTGTYYIWSGKKYGERIRICASSSNLGNVSKVIGWINIKDIQ